MSTSTRPAFTFEGLQTTELGGWPQEIDGEPEKLTRIFSFERGPYGVAASTKARLGVGNEFNVLGKVLWGRLDETTNTMWVRYDHLVARSDVDCVMREARWVRLSDFVSRFPRSQMPFDMGHSVAIYTNRSCHRPNPNKDDDNHEPMFMVNNPDDRLDEDEELDWSQQPRMIDEAGCRFWWREEFGGGN